MIVITNEIEFKWLITGSAEAYILSLSPEELETYFEFKYAQLEQELRQQTDADIFILNTEVEILE
jgi:hypothetical protein